MPNPPGPFPLDGVEMPTWILRYDKRGATESPQTLTALVDHIRASDYTDVIAFSHGWNNDFDDALELYRDFLKEFERAVRSHPPTRRFKPLFFGIVWPSTWLVFDTGPAIAAGGAVAAPSTREVQDELAARIEARSGAPAVETFNALMKKETLTDDEARSLAEIIAPAFQLVDDELQDERALTAEDVLSMLSGLERASRPGSTAVPDIDDWGTPGADVEAEPQVAGLFQKLDPRSAVRLFSVYQMKDRAGTVGYNGMAPLLRSVLSATEAKVHVVGHSYGCKVMLSAICNPAALSRPVRSLLLLEPAVSYLCFAARVPQTTNAGGYRLALDNTHVERPILSTYSSHDFPLHGTFHLALRRDSDLGEAKIAGTVSTTAGDPPNKFAALGGYGPRGAGERLVDPIPAAGTPYPDLGGASIIGLDGSQGAITSHGDVRTATTAWALHQLAFR